MDICKILLYYLSLLVWVKVWIGYYDVMSNTRGEEFPKRRPQLCMRQADWGNGKLKQAPMLNWYY